MDREGGMTETAKGRKDEGSNGERRATEVDEQRSVESPHFPPRALAHQAGTYLSSAGIHPCALGSRNINDTSHAIA